MASLDMAPSRSGTVIPAKAGTQPVSGPFPKVCEMDSRFRRSDVWSERAYRANYATTRS